MVRGRKLRSKHSPLARAERASYLDTGLGKTTGIGTLASLRSLDGLEFSIPVQDVLGFRSFLPFVDIELDFLAFH
jgi:hypothetical protein